MRFMSRFRSAVLWVLPILMLQMATPGAAGAEMLAWLWDDGPTKLGKKVAGEWQQGSREFVFQSGAMSFLRTGVVFASYQALDEETLRFRRVTSDTNWDWIVKVKFPASNRMVWYRVQSGSLKEWWSFDRIVPVNADEKYVVDGVSDFATALNKDLPQNLNELTRWDSATARGTVLTCRYTLITTRRGEVNPPDFAKARASIFQNTINKICSGDGLNALLKVNATLRYDYYDMTGAYIPEMSFIVTKKDCPGLR